MNINKLLIFIINNIIRINLKIKMNKLIKFINQYNVIEH